jgi:hypothetical protein
LPGFFAYFGFDDPDRMRSSSFRSSAVSSAIVLVGGLRKGITSAMLEFPLGQAALPALTLPQLAHFCGTGFSLGGQSAIINSNSSSTGQF